MLASLAPDLRRKKKVITRAGILLVISNGTAAVFNEIKDGDEAPTSKIARCGPGTRPTGLHCIESVTEKHRASGKRSCEPGW